MNASCESCKNCEKVNEGTPKEFWCCELYGWRFGLPAPADVTPPNDKPCKYYNTKKATDVAAEIARFF